MGLDEKTFLVYNYATINCLAIYESKNSQINSQKIQSEKKF